MARTLIQAIAESNLVPEAFRGRPDDLVVVLDIANKIEEYEESEETDGKEEN